MNTENTLFTVGICSSERPEYLAQAVRSIFKQSHSGSIEIIIADDNSVSFRPKDLVAQLSNELCVLRPGSQLRLVQPKKTNEISELNNPIKASKAGEAAMRNLVITHSTGRFIVWLDDDDVLLPVALESYASRIEANPTPRIIYPNLLRTNENLDIEREYTYRSVPQSLVLPSLLMGSIFPNGGSCIARAVFDKVGSYDTTFEVATDYQFWARAALAGINFEHMPVAVYLYRSHSANAALDKEDERFFRTNARVTELILRNTAPEVTFPFFEWKKDPVLADFQVLLACMILAERNREETLIQRTAQMLTMDIYKQYLGLNTFQQIINAITTLRPLSFDSTAQLLAALIKAGALATENTQATTNTSAP